MEKNNIGWNTEVSNKEEITKTKQRVAKVQEKMGVPVQPVVDTRPQEPVSVNWGSAPSEEEKFKVKERVAEIKKEIGLTSSIPKLVVDTAPSEPAVAEWNKNEASEEEKNKMKERIAEIKTQEAAENKKKEDRGAWGKVRKFFSSFFGK